MVKKEVIKIKKSLIELFKEKGINVERIVLFGSYVKGKRSGENDIDIIVVSKDFRNKSIFEIANLKKNIHWKLVENFMKPFDIMCYSDYEWDEGNSLIINTAKTEGEVIYELKSIRV